MKLAPDLMKLAPDLMKLASFQDVAGMGSVQGLGWFQDADGWANDRPKRLLKITSKNAPKMPFE
jgi:hypothetical protein